MSVRDKDYRGQKRPADFTRLVHMVRMGKPGALEVLQDLIEEYFPKQFREIRNKIKNTSTSFFITFNARIARNRFVPTFPASALHPFFHPKRRSRPTATSWIENPFGIRTKFDVTRKRVPIYEAVIWSNETAAKPIVSYTPRDKTWLRSERARLANEFSRRELVAFLEWNDPNGVYSDAFHRRNRLHPLTKHQALSLVMDTVEETRMTPEEMRLEFSRIRPVTPPLG